MYDFINMIYYNDLTKSRAEAFAEVFDIWLVVKWAQFCLHMYGGRIYIFQPIN